MQKLQGMGQGMMKQNLPGQASPPLSLTASCSWLTCPGVSGVVSVERESSANGGVSDDNKEPYILEHTHGSARVRLRLDSLCLRLSVLVDCWWICGGRHGCGVERERSVGSSLHHGDLHDLIENSRHGSPQMSGPRKVSI